MAKEVKPLSKMTNEELAAPQILARGFPVLLCVTFSRKVETPPPEYPLVGAAEAQKELALLEEEVTGAFSAANGGRIVRPYSVADTSSLYTGRELAGRKLLI